MELKRKQGDKVRVVVKAIHVLPVKEKSLYGYCHVPILEMLSRRGALAQISYKLRALFPGVTRPEREHANLYRNATR